MKRFRWSSFLAAFLIIGMLVGCAVKTPSVPVPTPAPFSAKPKTLTIAGYTTTASMDIHQVSDSPSFTVLGHINETLFVLTPTGEVKPGLADSYTLSADSRTATIKLKSGIRFSDSTPFNAAAVKQNLDRILDPASGAAFRSLVNLVSGVAAPDDSTVVLTLSKPFAPLQRNLGHSGTAIIAPSALAKGPAWLATNTIGTGPYVLKEYKKDTSVTLTFNPRHHGDRPAISEVTYKAVKEDGARMLEVESGRSDVALRIPPAEVDRLKGNANIRFTQVPSASVLFVVFNTSQPPFNNVKVRQAINYAIDKDSIVSTLLAGAGRVLDAPLAPEIFGYAPQPVYKRDLVQAKKLLAEAKVEPGTRIVLHHPTGRYVQDAKVAEAIAVQLKDVGLIVELKTMEWADYLAFTGKKQSENTLQMGMFGWSTPTLDADYGLYNLFHSSQWPDNGGFNQGFYKNAAVDAQLDLGRQTADPVNRMTHYTLAQNQIWADAPWIFLHSQVEIQAIKTDVSGLEVFATERMNWLKADRN